MGDSGEEGMQKEWRLVGRHWKVMGILGMVVSLGATTLYSAELKQNQTRQQLIAQGKQIFLGNCVPCHGEKGKGDGPAAQTLPEKPRDLTNPQTYKIGASLETIMQTVSNGIPGTPMAPWSIKLTPDQIRAVANYVLADLQKAK